MQIELEEAITRSDIEENYKNLWALMKEQSFSRKKIMGTLTPILVILFVALYGLLFDNNSMSFLWYFVPFTGIFIFLWIFSLYRNKKRFNALKDKQIAFLQDREMGVHRLTITDEYITSSTSFYNFKASWDIVTQVNYFNNQFYIQIGLFISSIITIPLYKLSYNDRQELWGFLKNKKLIPSGLEIKIDFSNELHENK